MMTSVFDSKLTSQERHRRKMQTDIFVIEQNVNVLDCSAHDQEFPGWPVSQVYSQSVGDTVV